MKTLQLILCCCCLFIGTTLVSQNNLITNSQLEISSCGDNDEICPHFEDCLEGWEISHGTPNYKGSACPNNPRAFNNHVQFVCRKGASEGMLTNVDLEAGPHRLFVRARVTNIPTNLDVNLRISLDQGITTGAGEGPSNCQEQIPWTSETKTIYNSPLNDDGEWHWIIIDLDLDNTSTHLDQLMFTGLTSDLGQAIINIDCIYLYYFCSGSDPIIFSSLFDAPISIDDGNYISCSYILSDNPVGGVSVPVGSQVNMIAKDYILWRPSFHAQNTLCAKIKDAVPEFDNDYRPPCDGCPGNNQNITSHLHHQIEKSKQSNSQSNIDSIAKEVILSPNPATNGFALSLPTGEWDIYIYDLLGRKKDQFGANQKTYVNTSKWDKGIYFITVINQQTQKKTTKKLLIQ